MPQWLQEVSRYSQNPQLVKVLAGNKTDLADHAVTKEEGSTYAASNSMEFFEMSAKDNVGVNEAFQWTVDKIVRIQCGESDSDGSGKGCCLVQ